MTLSTFHSNAQEDMDQWKHEVNRIQKERDEMTEKHQDCQKQHYSLQERFIIAQVEISKLKSEHLSVGNKARWEIEQFLYPIATKMFPMYGCNLAREYCR